ncbi:MAG: DUF3817 domain-containing protein [Deltaproteobacteria bacterium]|nr:MAG: DUF3817 domain-containing protein [Deltaproteobacteria bacterium]
MSPDLRWFLWVARAEGVSLLLLFGLAMPLKYGAGIPELVQPIGMAHGALFMVYLIALWHTGRVERWGALRYLLGFVASLLPFGTFIFERRLG